MRHLSALLAGELARAAREVIENTEDTAERAEALGELIGKFAQLRREENQSVRGQVIQERWDWEVAKEVEHRKFSESMSQNRALSLQRLCLDLFSRGNEEPEKSTMPGAIATAELATARPAA
jgi:hypothetical protein